MREILITSKVHGEKIVFVDDKDFEVISKYRWHISKKKKVFYANATTGGHKVPRVHIKMHRLIMNVTDYRILIDHIDGNGLNNQRVNLRECDNAQNMRNGSKRKDNTTGYKGVGRSFGKFRARVRINGVDKHLGYFNTAIEAALAYNDAASKSYGEFAKLNTI